jgi:peptide/nickel transport system permease protein
VSIRRVSTQRVGAALLAGLALVTVLAPLLAPHDPTEPFADRAYAPPMRIRVRDADGFRAPFVYRQVLEDRLERRYRDDTSRAIPIRWGRDWQLMSIPAEDGPLLVLGADALGRDVFSRLLFGARLSLGVTVLGVAGALFLGFALGGLAGGLGGRVDTALMLVADFILVLPGAYLVLVLRGVLPLLLSTAQVFWLMAVLFAVAAWPHVARGVRAIVATERARDYAEAILASGAGPFRLVAALLPAARGFALVEVVLLVPALLVAEATVSFLGLGFYERDASWGRMLQDAANIRVMAEAPWMLAPALALFLVVLGVQLVGWTRTSKAELLLADRR